MPQNALQRAQGSTISPLPVPPGGRCLTLGGVTFGVGLAAGRTPDWLGLRAGVGRVPAAAEGGDVPTELLAALGTAVSGPLLGTIGATGLGLVDDEGASAGERLAPPRRTATTTATPATNASASAMTSTGQ